MPGPLRRRVVDPKAWVVGHQYGGLTPTQIRQREYSEAMNLGRRGAKLAREALELEQEMSERIDVGPSEHVVILVRKLKKAVTALEGEVEKLGPGPKQFFAQAKYLANENMRIWGRVAPILLFGSPVTSFWNKPAEAFID